MSQPAFFDKHPSQYKQGDIVIAKVPYQDGTGSKKRVVLIISNNYLDSFLEFIFIPLTTKNIKNECLFPIDKQYLSPQSRVQGSLRLNKLSSLNKTKIIKKVDEISPEFVRKAVIELNKLLEVND